VTHGDPAGLHLTNTATHDFNTLALTGTTDPNNLTVSYSYDRLTRPTQTSFPTGATQTTTYNDTTLSVSSSLSFTENGVTLTATTAQVANGWGQPVQTVNIHGGQVNISYDAMGRVSSQTNPFTQGGTPGPSTSYSYDALGRLQTTTLPNGNTLQSTYSGINSTGTDQVSRQMRGQIDGLARLVKVTEQDATGTLAQDTNYTYDLLDRLTQVDQGGQTRSLKYDAMGRLLFEKIPEQNATINDGSGTLWSASYTYTDFHAVQKKTDARGVETHYKYDALNRLIQVWYTGVGGDDLGNVRPALPSGVAATSDVNYVYNTSGASNGLLQSVSVGSGCN
jgi:YD repeat-containing protein